MKTKELPPGKYTFKITAVRKRQRRDARGRFMKGHFVMDMDILTPLKGKTQIVIG